MRARNAEIVEQAFALGDVVGPGDRLDAAARLAAFAAIERNAGEFLRQVIEEPDLRVDAERRPGFDDGIEAARRIHQKRRSAAQDLVTRGNAVNADAWHGIADISSRTAPLSAHSCACGARMRESRAGAPLAGGRAGNQRFHTSLAKR